MIVVWRVTQRCNLSCAFCAYDMRLPGARAEADPDAVLRLAEPLGRLRRRSGERVLVSWLGGEPFLWAPLFEISRQLRARWDLAISATTNGTTLHRRAVRRQVLESFSELTVSIDGDFEFHERLRGWRDGARRLATAIQALVDERGEAGAPLRLRVNTVLMRDNVAMFETLCERLAELGIDEITFNALGGRDRPEFFPAHRLRSQDVERLAALLPDLRRRLALRGVRLCGSDRYLERLHASAAGRAMEVADCAPGQRFLFVDEQGRVSPCSFTSLDYGATLEDSVDLQFLPAHFARLRRERPLAVCSDCPSTQVHAKFAAAT